MLRKFQPYGSSMRKLFISINIKTISKRKIITVVYFDQLLGAARILKAGWKTEYRIIINRLLGTIYFRSIGISIPRSRMFCNKQQPHTASPTLMQKNVKETPTFFLAPTLNPVHRKENVLKKPPLFEIISLFALSLPCLSEQLLLLWTAE